MNKLAAIKKQVLEMSKEDRELLLGELRLANKRDYAKSKPCVLVELTGNIRGFPHNMRNPNKTVFICLDCYNYATVPPDFFKTMNIVSFGKDIPIKEESLCEVCNEYVHRIQKEEKK